MRLTTGLESLLDIAQKGEWEAIDGLLQELLQTLESVRSVSLPTLKDTAQRGQIERILQLLQSATLLCAERKDQIAPLVKAFVHAMDDQANP